MPPVLYIYLLLWVIVATVVDASLFTLRSEQVWPVGMLMAGLYVAFVVGLLVLHVLGLTGASNDQEVRIHICQMKPLQSCCFA